VVYFRVHHEVHVQVGTDLSFARRDGEEDVDDRRYNDFGQAPVGRIADVGGLDCGRSDLGLPVSLVGFRHDNAGAGDQGQLGFLDGPSVIAAAWQDSNAQCRT